MTDAASPDRGEFVLYATDDGAYQERITEGELAVKATVKDHLTVQPEGTQRSVDYVPFVSSGISITVPVV
jgi:hypothetical protein